MFSIFFRIFLIISIFTATSLSVYAEEVLENADEPFSEESLTEEPETEIIKNPDEDATASEEEAPTEELEIVDISGIYQSVEDPTKFITIHRRGDDYVDDDHILINISQDLEWLTLLGFNGSFPLSMSDPNAWEAAMQAHIEKTPELGIERFAFNLVKCYRHDYTGNPPKPVTFYKAHLYSCELDPIVFVETIYGSRAIIHFTINDDEIYFTFAEDTGWLYIPHDDKYVKVF